MYILYHVHRVAISYYNNRDEQRSHLVNSMLHSREGPHLFTAPKFLNHRRPNLALPLLHYDHLLK